MTGDAQSPEARLGAETYARRIAIEQFRDAEFRRIVTTKGTFLKVHVLRPVERAILRCLGLWEKGRRELLETVVRENDVCLGDALPAAFDGFRILHLSDLHIDIDEALVDAISRAVAPLDYNLCVMTGDYRSMTIGPSDQALALMERLRPAFKTDVLCVLGNHDFAEMVPRLESAGYRVLLNEGVVLRRGGAALYVAGIDDPVIFETHDIAKALSGAPAGCAKILLSHSARVWEEAGEAGVSLLLAGHTHGGQICLPGGWMLLCNDLMPRRCQKGAWRLGDVLGYVSSGCGASGLACRLNCPAEVVVHTLRCA